MVLESIKSLLKQLLEPRYRDAVADPRSFTERVRDYKYREDVILPSSGAISKKRITKLPFDAYKQGSTSSCGAHAAAHVRRLLEDTETYALQWYRARTNYSGEGMFLKDVLTLAAKADTVAIPKKLPKLTEAFANSLSYVELFDNTRDTQYEYAQIDPYDADAVAEVSSAGHGVVISFYATNKEWDEEVYEREYTTLFTAPVRHFVTVLPNSVHTKDGYTWVSAIDSAAPKGYTLTHIRLDFLKKRMYLGGGFYYPVTRRKSPVKYLPTNRCEYGQMNQAVLNLQEFLVTQGLMSKVHTTSYYGNITAAAVLKWQLQNVDSVSLTELNSLGGKYWGPASIKALRRIFQNT